MGQLLFNIQGALYYAAPFFIVVIFSTSLTFIFVMVLIGRDDRMSLLIVLLSLACLGAAVGITGGASRVGAVGDIMAATLGLMGGIVIWLFAADRSKGTIVSVCAICFSVSMFFGYQQGASIRILPSSYNFWRDQCVEIYTDVDALNDERTFSMMDRGFFRLCNSIFEREKSKLLRQ